MNTPDPASNTPENGPKEEKSFFSIIVHSFFIVPFLIAVFGVLLFVSVRILTIEEHSVYDYLADVKTGGLTKRWQAAFELSKILANKDMAPGDDRFEGEMISAFKHAKHDDDRVRQYLALAMARTGNPHFVEPILNALDSEKEENLYALIYALGVLRDQRAADKLYPYLKHPNARVRLVSAMALGNLGDRDAAGPLKEVLHDPEPNVQWDAAIALAKLGDLSGRAVLLQLLSRGYLDSFEQIDQHEKTHILLVTIEAASGLNDPEIREAVKQLSENEQSMQIRRAALEALD
jgi:HEAT repeat protein